MRLVLIIFLYLIFNASANDWPSKLNEELSQSIEYGISTKFSPDEVSSYLTREIKFEDDKVIFKTKFTDYETKNLRTAELVCKNKPYFHAISFKVDHQREGSTSYQIRVKVSENLLDYQLTKSDKTKFSTKVLWSEFALDEFQLPFIISKLKLPPKQGMVPQNQVLQYIAGSYDGGGLGGTRFIIYEKEEEIEISGKKFKCKVFKTSQPEKDLPTRYWVSEGKVVQEASGSLIMKIIIDK